MSIVSIPVLLDSSASISSTYTSPSFRYPNSLGYAIQAVFTGSSPTGTFKIQESIDNTNWNDRVGTSIDITAAGTAGWEVDISYNLYARVVYTRVSGTGTLTFLWLNTKQ